MYIFNAVSMKLALMIIKNLMNSSKSAFKLHEAKWNRENVKSYKYFELNLQNNKKL